MTAGQPTTPSDRAGLSRADATPLNVVRADMRPLGLRIEDAGKMVGVSRSTMFTMIRTGQVEARKIGAATVVTYASLERLFQAAPLSDATKRAQAKRS